MPHKLRCVLKVHSLLEDTKQSTKGGGSAHDIFRGSGFIQKEYIMSPLTSIINFRHFYSFLASYSKIPTQGLLPGPMDSKSS